MKNPLIFGPQRMPVSRSSVFIPSHTGKLMCWSTLKSPIQRCWVFHDCVWTKIPDVRNEQWCTSMHDISDFVACPTVSFADQPTCCIVFWWCKLNFSSGIPIYDLCIYPIVSTCFMAQSMFFPKHEIYFISMFDDTELGYSNTISFRHLRSHGSSEPGDSPWLGEEPWTKSSNTWCSYGHLSVITGYFNGIIHSINGVIRCYKYL